MQSFLDLAGERRSIRLYSPQPAPEEEVRSIISRLMEVPEEYRIFTILPLGYPAETPAPRPRNVFEQVTSRERYGGRRSEGR